MALKPIKGLPYQVALSSKQIWAVGMVSTQWSALEITVDKIIETLADGENVLKDHKGRDSRQERLTVWRTLVNERIAEAAFKSRALSLIQRVGELKGERDRVIHGLWGQQWQKADAAPLPPDTEKITVESHAFSPGPTFTWRLTYDRIMQTAKSISMIHRDLILMGSPDALLSETWRQKLHTRD